MTANNPLTEHETELLAILRANGGWMSRRDIARALRTGLLHAHGVRYEYRIKPPVADGG